ncbi:hypothetical protein ACFS5J_07445 [Flavobacterium chuncheonense]|uniref:Uncharacterized protein n=1 Tax=Flavobacterium chuncheonense TaxID=2026653 RepID=A0ABW5YLC2_9FLAO
MKIGPLAILLLLISFGIMLVTILDWIPNNPLQDYKIIAALQFIILSRLIVRRDNNKN